MLQVQKRRDYNPMPLREKSLDMTRKKAERSKQPPIEHLVSPSQHSKKAEQKLTHDTNVNLYSSNYPEVQSYKPEKKETVWELIATSILFLGCLAVLLALAIYIQW